MDYRLAAELMHNEPFYLTPNLSIFLTWGSRVTNALYKRFHLVMFNRLKATPQMQQEYDAWESAQAAAYTQILQFFKVTGMPPMVGDELIRSSRKGDVNLPGLSIEKRIIFSIPDSDELQLVYELGSPEIEELEEYQEGDLVEAEDET